MKNGVIKRIFGTVTAVVMCVAALPSLTSSAANVGDVLRVGNGATQHKGNCDGYSYELWLDNTGGSGSMTLGKGATFKAEWSASVTRGNYLARRGLDFGSQKKATAYDYIGMDYAATYKQTGSAQGNSRLCVYGWFQNKNAGGNVPLVEYYIIEDWVDWVPDAQGKIVTIDNAKYKIFKMSHTGPSINSGNETFTQYFSVRQEKRTSGHITVSDHFKAWENEGWGIGNLYEVALNAEGWQSSGVADVTQLDVYTDPEKHTITTEPTEPKEPVQPDENGYYFHSTFENGTDDWAGRGEATAASTNSEAYAGSKSLSVSNRGQNWHGAQISIDPDAFIPGETYSFSVGAMQNLTSSEDFKLTLQYNDGEEKYDTVATATGGKGEWVQLSNTSYTIPKGASSMILYVETADTTTSFYIDEAVGAVKGTKVDFKSTAITRGDVNNDGNIDIFDASLAKAAVRKSFAGESYSKAADVNGDGVVTVADVILIQQFILRKITEFPEPQKQDTPVEDPEDPQISVDPTSYMAKMRADIKENEPSSATNGNSNYGTVEKKSYFSSTANRTKKCNVLLPANYSSSKKYPVLYLLHGIFGNEDSMLDQDMAVRSLLGNLVQNGQAEEMIIVMPDMFSSATMSAPGGMDLATTQGYDNFLNEIEKDLMPFIEQNYSVKTGRNNTAITGFSMGGREALYIGVSRPNLFGYVGAACPAPGVTPGSDMYMNHPGCMQESEFKFKSGDPTPYVLLISGAVNDGVVGTFPKQYSNILSTNGVDNIYHSVGNGGHGGNTVRPHLYNFLRYVFKAA